MREALFRETHELPVKLEGVMEAQGFIVQDVDVVLYPALPPYLMIEGQPAGEPEHGQGPGDGGRGADVAVVGNVLIGRQGGMAIAGPHPQDAVHVAIYGLQHRILEDQLRDRLVAVAQKQHSVL